MSKIIAILMTVILVFGVFAPMTVAAEETSGTTCQVQLTLSGVNKDSVDYVVLNFVNKETRAKTMVEFNKANDWKAITNLEPGKYTIKFYSAGNRHEVELDTNTIEIPNKPAIAATLNVKKMLDNHFWPKFFRNNTFTLILLVITGGAYYILRRRRLLRGR